ncbi:MAG TPA: NADH-ubiquinone oxidoreductase-F iron-sulfur binding region domain-containing protein [Streptosporangiaceae bacterium]|jgi:NADH:ubiquinone oxidoreductase subunit F (NADH-binding)|nr:NADH-ubiquinone oxidoreductase-F iron-sulfur binding region domain-containing protein [Streptosporangiaceae bacterium]
MSVDYLAAAPPAPITGLPRLIPADAQADQSLAGHLARLGPVRQPVGPSGLIAEAEAAGLTGRGGAAFPVYRKLAAVAGQARDRRRAVVVANGAEGEPASGKDAALLWGAPHLVLDGLQLAAQATGATEAFLYVHRGEELSRRLLGALRQRSAAGLDQLEVEFVQAPDAFLAGEESALVSWINGGPARPAFKQPPVYERGVAGLPTLVQNVETLAHLGLIARFGAGWFRAAGTPAEPGTMLVTVHRADGTRYITETGLGTPLSALLPDELTRTGGGGHEVTAVLAGGYHGAWLAPRQAAGLALSNASLRPAGAFAGAGVLAALPAGRCGLAETARVGRYLALESAGQCGPCFNGLPHIAGALGELAGPRPRRQALADVQRWAGLVTGRGACHHPDGFVRFVRSALTVFRAELDAHASGRCTATDHAPFLPVPGS